MNYQSPAGNTARPTEYFKTIDADVAKAFDDFRDAVMASAPMNNLECELIIIAGLAGCDKEQTFRTHARRLIEADYPRQQLYQSILCCMGATMTFPQGIAALHWIDDLYEEAGKS